MQTQRRGTFKSSTKRGFSRAPSDWIVARIALMSSATCTFFNTVDTKMDIALLETPLGIRVYSVRRTRSLEGGRAGRGRTNPVGLLSEMTKGTGSLASLFFRWSSRGRLFRRLLSVGRSKSTSTFFERTVPRTVVEVENVHLGVTSERPKQKVFVGGLALDFSAPQVKVRFFSQSVTLARTRGV